MFLFWCVCVCVCVSVCTVGQNSFFFSVVSQLLGVLSPDIFSVDYELNAMGTSLKACQSHFGRQAFVSSKTAVPHITILIVLKH